MIGPPHGSQRPERGADAADSEARAAARAWCAEATVVTGADGAVDAGVAGDEGEERAPGFIIRSTKNTDPAASIRGVGVIGPNRSRPSLRRLCHFGTHFTSPPSVYRGRPRP